MTLTPALGSEKFQLFSNLGRVAEVWLAPSSAIRRQAVAALEISTGYTPAMIGDALDAAFEELTEAKVRRFYEGEPGFGSVKRPAAVLHILAGNVFTSWLPGAVTTLLLDANCALKPSGHEPVFAYLWQRSLEDIDRQLASKVKLVRWHEDLLENYDTVIAYGTDTTLQELQARMPAGRRFIGYGHKFSVGIIWEEALSDREGLLRRLQNDVRTFSLQGCLSPKILFVEGKNPEVLPSLGQEISALPELRSFDNWDALRTQLQSYKPHLSTVGCAGPPERVAPLREAMGSLGISRICNLGEMQRPPLSWPNGGFSLVDALTGG